MKKLFLSMVFMSIIFCSYSQDYKTAGGFRGGESYGFTLRYFENETTAFEGLLSFREQGMQLHVLKETFMPVFLSHTSHMFLYKGYGAHLGYGSNRDYFNGRYSFFLTNRRPIAGLDAIVGLEYIINKWNMSASLDFKPYAEVGGYRFFKMSLWDCAFTVRYFFR